jgi:hypothetical protein
VQAGLGAIVRRSAANGEGLPGGVAGAQARPLSDPDLAPIAEVRDRRETAACPVITRMYSVAQANLHDVWPLARCLNGCMLEQVLSPLDELAFWSELASSSSGGAAATPDLQRAAQQVRKKYGQDSCK